MKTLAICTIIGIAAGLLGALCGVGGGIVMVPAFVAALGFEQKKAVATLACCDCCDRCDRHRK